MSVGLYYMKREAEGLPPIRGGLSAKAWAAFARNRWWVFGVALQTFAYGVYILALRWAPLSIVHTAMDGGIAVFVLMAVIGLGERLRGVEWVGVVAVTIGLVLLGSTLEEHASAPAAGLSITFFSVLSIGISVFAVWGDRRPRREIGWAVAAGVLLGLAGLFAKQLSAVDSFAEALAGPLWTTLLTNAAGFAAMQATLQGGRGVVVVPIFSVISNIVPIAGGAMVFGEPLIGSGRFGFVRPVSMLLALTGAALLANRREA